MKQPVILLTACINPNGMAYTVLQDSDERLRQYRAALDWYLLHVMNKIVFVENTGYDISPMYENAIASGRLEVLTFQGNDFDKSKGKGYGEALIIEYAINNSKLISKESIIVKISGRYIINNVERLVQTSVMSSKAVNADYQISCKNIISYFFIAPYSFYKDYFLPNKNSIDDNSGRWFEYVLLDSILNWKYDQKYHYFFKVPIVLTATAGSTNEKYPPVTIINYINKFVKYWLYRLGLFKIS